MTVTRRSENSQQTPPGLLPRLAKTNSVSSGQNESTIEQWRNETNASARKRTTNHHSRSYLHRQRSRKHEAIGRNPKHYITVDTSFTTHRGKAPREVLSHTNERNEVPPKKQSWFGMKRSSGNHVGLGITRGTPQVHAVHRNKQSIDRNEPTTAASQASVRTFPDISPWDRQIPIGISVPTDSVPDFSPHQSGRHRSGSDATLVTPNIVITPAAPLQSVWSPDTPFSDSDYTPSTRSFKPAGVTIPPVPALPSGEATQGVWYHSRNDTLDSAGTAFEEDDELKEKTRIMSTSTVFEEDTTPLRDQRVENTLTLDTTTTTTMSTPRRSQGWWNFITTPFVLTPNTATFPQSGQQGHAPSLLSKPPTHYYLSEDAPTSPSAYTWSATDSLPLKPLPSTPTTSLERRQSETQFQERSSPAVVAEEHHSINSVLVKQQQPQKVHLNIEPQAQHSLAASQAIKSTGASAVEPTLTSLPAPRKEEDHASIRNLNSSQWAPPRFAPPPTFTPKKSHFSSDDMDLSLPIAISDAKKKKEKFWRAGCFRHFSTFKQKQHQTSMDSEEGGKEKREKKKKKKRGGCFWSCCCCLIFFILLVVLIPVIVVLTRKHKATVTQQGRDGQSQWLTLPNSPPIPTGVSTIAQPEAVEEESGCVAPTTLWSCALPKELQASVQPNSPDQPNFEIQITYSDGSATRMARRTANPVSAGALVRSQLLRIRSTLSPSPAPPSEADRKFVGQTTDGNAAPYEGEETPLFITFQNPQGSKARLIKRADASDPTNITAVIPAPMLGSDGSAAPANLLPLPSMQPLRLFNRGKDSEHYGFYTYFDRSIFLKDINGDNRGGNAADMNGGSTKDAASLRCTFAETRFLVQIWTKSQNSKPLLQRSASNESAALRRPGTFAYPVTITIDRHGGNAAKKNLYCYHMESDGTIEDDASKRFFEFEDRAFGGSLVNGTQGQLNATGLIDGGSGGCRCTWQNWLR